jgi:hypothetical protein
VTARGGVVYVLNAGGAGNIAGFRVDTAGDLHAIAGSTLPLSAAGVTPTEVAFSPDGDTLKRAHPCPLHQTRPHRTFGIRVASEEERTT